MDIAHYQTYRWFYTSEGTLVVGGKNALQNDALLNEIKATKKEYYVLHTSHPGSPFAIVLKQPGRVTETELQEAAIFTGCFSRAWKERKKKTTVDLFKTSQLSKEKDMKNGTWRVTGSVKKLEVSLELALVFQKKIIRAVPCSTHEMILLHLLPGKTDKKDMIARIAVELDDRVGTDALLSALPAGGVSIRSIKAPQGHR